MRLLIKLFILKSMMPSLLWFELQIDSIWSIYLSAYCTQYAFKFNNRLQFGKEILSGNFWVTEVIRWYYNGIRRLVSVFKDNFVPSEEELKNLIILILWWNMHFVLQTSWVNEKSTNISSMPCSLFHLHLWNEPLASFLFVFFFVYLWKDVVI